eukprot:COSAG05_NODE_7964_length_751_cov_1.239264_1_plen_20_part_10
MLFLVVGTFRDEIRGAFRGG